MKKSGTHLHRPVALIVVSGWGVAPPSEGNPLSIARMPVIDRLIRSYPALTLEASGKAIGLASGTPGQAELGHLIIGAGRVVSSRYLNQDDLPKKPLTETLSAVLSESKLTQMHIAETEKFVHATTFFSGGYDRPNKYEDWIFIPSPTVSFYHLKPEMSALKIAVRVMKELSVRAAGRRRGREPYDFLLINFANLDMVSHTGHLKATVKAAEAVDKALGKIIEALLFLNGVVLITADHGAAEHLLDLRTETVDTEHTANRVPFLMVSKEWEGKLLSKGGEAHGGDLSLTAPSGTLADIAPTIIDLFRLKKPSKMTGRSLLNI